MLQMQYIGLLNTDKHRKGSVQMFIQGRGSQARVGTFASFDFHPTLTGVLGASLVGHQIVQMYQPSQKHLVALCGMMQGIHHEEFAV